MAGSEVPAGYQPGTLRWVGGSGDEVQAEFDVFWSGPLRSEDASAGGAQGAPCQVTAARGGVGVASREVPVPAPRSEGNRGGIVVVEFPIPVEDDLGFEVSCGTNPAAQG